MVARGGVRSSRGCFAQLQPPGDSIVFDTIGTPGLWAAFAAFVVAALAIDLWVMDRRSSQTVGVKAAASGPSSGSRSRSPSAPALWVYLDGAAGREVANEKAGRVPHRLPHREEPLGGQHLRVPDALHLLRGAARAPAQGPGAGRAGRHRAARGDDPHRRLAHRALPLDPLPVRPVPARHGRQDDRLRRRQARPREEPGAALDARAPRHHDRVPRRPLLDRARAAGAGSRRSSWCWCSSA